MAWLSSQAGWLLLVECLAVALLAVIVGRVLATRLVPAPAHEGIRPVAGPLMPALGATFAVLAAIPCRPRSGT